MFTGSCNSEAIGLPIVLFIKNIDNKIDILSDYNAWKVGNLYKPYIVNN